MPNLFDVANYPSKEPIELTIGDRWQWKRTDLGTDYPPASYTLKYSARLDAAGANEIEITATASGSDFIVEVPSATTLAYTAGTWRWQAYITRNSDSQRITLNSGSFEVKPNRDAALTDPRSWAKQCLDSIEAAIKGVVANPVKTYQISTDSGSRSVTRRDLPELLKMRQDLKAEVDGEKIKERMAAGSGDPRRIGIRLIRV
jgi:hypothetical protein